MTARRRILGARGHNVWVLVPGVLALVIWQLVSGPVIPKLYISTPWDVASRLWSLFSTGDVFPDLWTTAQELLIGYGVGVLVGVLAGYGLGRWRAGARIFEPYITAAYGIPLVTLAPLFIIWFGIGIWSKVTICAILVFFIVFFSVYGGVRGVSRDYIDVIRIMGANQSQLTRHVYLHATMPHIFMGLRSALPFAVIGVTVGEFISAFRGLGLYINRASTTLDPAGVFAGIMIFLAFILVAKFLLSLVERRVLRWHTSVRPSESPP
jgi:NitT/TauT family transport system permease protein